jgi:hypothetical protein
MKGIYTYIPETNNIPKEYNVAAILSLLFMVPISLVRVLTLQCTFTLALLLLLLQELEGSLQSAPGKLYALKCDVTKEQEIKEAFKWVKDNLGGVDILVNNAAADRNNSLCGNSNITFFTVTLLSPVLRASWRFFFKSSATSCPLWTSWSPSRLWSK